MTFDEEIESNAENGDSNWVYTKNPQEKEDFAKATSKDQESESTKTNFDPLFSLLSPKDFWHTPDLNPPFQHWILFPHQNSFLAKKPLRLKE